MKKVYVRVSGSDEYSVEGQIVGVFTSAQDARDCAWGNEVIALPLHEGPAEFKEHFTFLWHMNQPEPDLVFSAKRIFDGAHEPVHVWARESKSDATLIVTGWDEKSVRARLDDLRADWQRGQAA